MTTKLDLRLDPESKKPLTEQIRLGILEAIDSGILKPDSKLPSWNGLASQLGVARGTVKAAYERLSDEQVIVASTAGTRVAKRLSGPKPTAPYQDGSALPDFYHQLSSGPAIFQMGVPAQETFPAKLISKLRVRSVRKECAAAPVYPDPRGEYHFRSQIAAYLSIGRGVRCNQSQVFITHGFAGGLALVLRALDLAGKAAWVENPSYPVARRALELASVTPCPVPVDDDGIDVGNGRKTAPHAAVVMVTPGQQAPLGMTMSLDRRVELLEWAEQSGAWIIEDDYLGEMQLEGRASPALAALDRNGEVIHIGSFSKTISPSLRLGFVVVPTSLVSRFADAVIYSWPAPGPSVQDAVSQFIEDGHYLRHLRRVRRDYGDKRTCLADALGRYGLEGRPSGLAVVVNLADGVPDIDVARSALEYGMAPAPLSPWYPIANHARSGLLLGIPNLKIEKVDSYCERLRRLIDKFSVSKNG